MEKKTTQHKKTPEEIAEGKKKSLKNLKKGNPSTQFKSGRNAIENGRKGGIKSGEAKRQAKTAKEIAEAILNGEHKLKDGGTATGKEMILMKQLEKAVQEKNLESAKFLLKLAGEDVSEHVDITSNGKTIQQEPLIVEVIDSRDKIAKDREATDD